MASFWSRLQIPSLISTKENGRQSTLLRGFAILQTVMKKNMRSFWLWKRKEREYGTGNCGKPPQKQIVEPCTGCPSKCLEPGYGKPIRKKKRSLFSLKSKEPEVIKEKPSNCEEIKPVEERSTWWESIFGPDPKRSWPDPCTCRLAVRQKKLCRAQDPRLKDPRYKETAGDVFLYTEAVKRGTSSCREPQPKPPPLYKVPKAVLYRDMCAGELALFRGTPKAEEEVYPVAKPFPIPFEEMRPPEKKRKVFTCQRGIRSRDTFRPTARDSNTYKLRSTVPKQYSPVISEDVKKKQAAAREKFKSDMSQGSQRRSRVEHLKYLVQQRDTLHCMSTN
ncbi:uncharacterized protein LOC100879542 [Megachile rotundata]|uniref:uncharacterized protein LOC100879542 n=1 Tax=Megachile rotundata TaxID=143995 RepID=UPI003FD07ED9